MNIEVRRDTSEELKRHIEQFHYLQYWPASALPFAYCLLVDGKRTASDGRLNGIVVMKKLQHTRQKGLFGYEGLPTAWQVLDLGRVWINPLLQGKSLTETFVNRQGVTQPCNLNIFSRMVSLVLHRVQWDWLEFHPPRYPDLPYHINLIVSYCELAHHDGIGYKASGFKSIGLSSDRTKEVYLRRLKQPQKSWRPMQPSLI